MIKERKWLVDLAGGAAVYPAAHQDMGIEPTYPAWKAGVLPLNYTRIGII